MKIPAPVPIIVFILLAIVLASYLPVVAQPEPGVFKRISEGPYGASEMNVNDVVQDQEGFMWIATAKGLLRYDGHDMRVFRHNPADTASISDNWVKVLVEDKKGGLWIGTASGGLSYFNRRRETFTHFLHNPLDSASLGTNEIDDLLLDSKGRLWVATSVGLYRLDQQTGGFIHYQSQAGNPESLGGNDIDCLEEDALGRIWIGSREGGLSYLNPETKKITRFLQDTEQTPGVDHKMILQIARDSNDYLWVSTGDTRLHRIDPNSLHLRSFSLYPSDIKDVEACSIWNIWPDKDGALWLGTHAKGLIHFSPTSGRATHYRHNPALPSSIASDLITAIWLDQDDNLWIGHQGPGLSRLPTYKSGFEILPIQFQKEDGSFYPAFRCLLEDRQGKIWAGTWGNGLYRYDPNTGETTSFKYQKNKTRGLASNIIWDLLEDSLGNIWIATHGGLQGFNPNENNFSTFGTAEDSRNRPVRSLWEDHSGKLWVGSFEGLYWLDVQLGKIRFETSIPNNANWLISELFEDSQNNLWIANYGQGVFRWNLLNGQWLHFQSERFNPKALTSNMILSIIEDDQSRIWLATSGGGLNRFLPHPSSPDSSSFQHWRPYNSDLPDENIFNLSLDTQNRLWLSTDKGLFSFHAETKSIKPYSLPGTITGLNVETRQGSQGFLYAGNTQHAYRFHPDSVWRNERIPPVFITDLQIKGQTIPIRSTFGDSLSYPSPLNQSILYTDSLKLKYWQNDLAFVFTGLNYIQPENNRYRYRLEGYDKDWIYTDYSNRHIRYTNLSPGAYSFRVEAANNENKWNKDGKTIHLRIYPPWQRSLAAKITYVFLLLGGLWGLRRYELRRQFSRAEARRLKELDVLKNKLYANITHEFRTPLTIIIGIVEQINTQVSEHAKESLRLIKRNGWQLLKLVNQMLDLSKLESGHIKLELQQGDIVNYLQYLIESFHSYAESKKIRLHFMSDLNEFYMDYDAVRLMHVMSNLLSNAIKFTPEGGNVYVSVQNQTPKKPPQVSKVSKTLNVLHTSKILSRKRLGIETLEIRVKDTGIGIPQEKIPFVFDRFYQVDDSSTRKGEGTGIGLTLTKELVTLMKGEIYIKSELGKGAEFKVLLPVSRRETLKNQKPEIVIPPLITSPIEAALPKTQQTEDKPLMLIAEDNPDLVKYLVNSFNPIYNLEVAYNGRHGIEKAIALIPDVIITDVMMPEKDGFELCASLKNHKLTSHIPIIMLTAKADVDSRLTGLRRGADAYLEKPFLQEELNIRIKGLLKQRQRLQAYYRSQAGLTESNGGTPPPETESQMENAFLNEINQIIEKHLKDELFKVEHLAQELFIDPSNLYRKLKALTGMPPNRYIRSLRLAKAKNLLLYSDLSVASIAEECGFSDQSYFSRIFKKENGLSPTKYRLQKQNLNGF